MITRESLLSGALKAVREPASPESTRMAQERTSWFREQFLPVFQEKFPELISGAPFGIVGDLANLRAEADSPIEIEVNSAHINPPSKGEYQQAVDHVVDKMSGESERTYQVIVKKVNPSIINYKT